MLASNERGVRTPSGSLNELSKARGSGIVLNPFVHGAKRDKRTKKLQRDMERTVARLD
jgi:hypothetical protein